MSSTLSDLLARSGLAGTRSVARPATATASAGSSLAGALAGDFPTSGPAARAGKSTVGGVGKLVSLCRSNLSVLSDEPGAAGCKCLGLIGQGAKFCLHEECAIASHPRHKFTVADDTLCIRNNECEAFCEPSLATSCVTADQLSMVMGDSKTKEDWVTEFGIVGAQAQGSPMSSDGVAQHLHFYEQAQQARTPHKRKASDTEDLLSGFRPLPKRSSPEAFVSEESLPPEFVARFRAVDNSVADLSTLVPTALGSVSVDSLGWRFLVFELFDWKRSPFRIRWGITICNLIAFLFVSSQL